MKKIYKFALGVEYNGTNYYGWQHQKTVCTIQEKLETALSKIANHKINVFCAGRTDAGVHSTGQVVHFTTHAIRIDKAWTLGVNSYLPNEIAIQWVKIVPDEFHARFSAIARRYYYLIYNNALRSTFLINGITHFYRPLDAEKMHHAAQCLLGEKDFTSFRAIGCQAYTPWRKIINLSVKRYNAYIIIDITANSFLYHMVRNIVGSLIEIGCGNKPESWLLTLLNAKNRALAAKTAKASGLYLVAVYYPTCFNLPCTGMDTFLFKEI